MISAAEQELMQSIIAAPDDDAPRLVLADWLSQQGELRGELIVTACTLNRADLPIGTRRALTRRHDALLVEHGARWLQELGLGADQGRFVRGMVEEVEAPFRQLAPHLDRLFASAPVRALRSMELDAKSFDILRHSPHLARLRSLTLDQLGPALMPLLLEHESLAGLESLRICNSGLADADLRTFVASDRFAALETLSLDRNRIGHKGAEALARPERLPRLRALDLAMNHVGDAGVRALASMPQIAALRQLNLNQNGLTAEGAVAIADTTSLTQLTSLDLGFNPIGDRGVSALSRSLWLKNLVRLDLARTRITSVAARALTSSTAFPKLEALELSHNYLPQSEEALVQAHFQGRVRLL